MAKRRTGSFWAFADDGERHMIVIYTEYADASTRGSREELEVAKERRTDKGEPVNRLEKGTYQVVQTGEILRSDDPKAP